MCLTCILPPEVVDGLQQVAATDRYEHLERRTDTPNICQHSAVGRALCEPISLWLIRQYLGTRDLHLAHPPNCIGLPPYAVESQPRAWHVDIPYIPSVGGNPAINTYDTSNHFSFVVALTDLGMDLRADSNM